MEVKNAFLVPEPQIHKSREATDAMGTPSMAGTRGRHGSRREPALLAELGSLPEGSRALLRAAGRSPPGFGAGPVGTS